MKFPFVPVMMISAVAVCGCGKKARPTEMATTVPAGARSAEPDIVFVAQPFLPALGTRVALGRDFLASDFEKSSPAVAILSAELFATAFGSRPNVIAQRLEISGHELTIVGIAPPQPAALHGRRVWVAARK